MKSVLITFDQAYYERIMALLDRLGCRGFTYLEKVQGRGSKTGDPHFGSHAWPSMCSAILTVVEDNKVDSLLDTLHKMDLQTEQLGLRAFVWTIIIDIPPYDRYLIHTYNIQETFFFTGRLRQTESRFHIILQTQTFSNTIRGNRKTTIYFGRKFPSKH